MPRKNINNKKTDLGSFNEGLDSSLDSLVHGFRRERSRFASDGRGYRTKKAKNGGYSYQSA